MELTRAFVGVKLKTRENRAEQFSCTKEFGRDDRPEERVSGGVIRHMPSWYLKAGKMHLTGMRERFPHYSGEVCY